jgi:hypothetical protein
VDALKLEIEREFDRRQRLCEGRICAGDGQAQLASSAAVQRKRVIGVVLGSGPIAA